jgi:hypothetical protein
VFRNRIIKITFIPLIVIALSMVIYVLSNPLDNSSNIGDFYSSNPDAGPDAEL